MTATEAIGRRHGPRPDETLPVRLRIGVTGHRTLPPDGAVANEARAAIARMVESLRTPTTPVALTIVSALAEGADRVVIDGAVAALPGDEVAIEAVLPIPAASYEADFADAASRREFRDLLARATRTIPMPAAGTREIAYERAGRHVAETSDVLIAVWDGEPARGRGGTAEIVDYAKRHGVPVVTIWPDEHRPERDRGWLPTLAETADRTAEYNRTSTRSGAFARQLAQEGADLDRLVGDSIIHWRFSAMRDWSLPCFVRADRLALKYQRRYTRLGQALYAASALAVTAVAAQWLFAEHESQWATSEVILMVVLLAAFAVGRRSRVHDRWVGYRSLAEALRGALFLGLTGLGEGDTVEEWGFATQTTSEPWYQRMFSEIWRTRPRLGADPSEARELARILAEGWIADQVRYHRRAAARHRAQRRRFTVAIFTLFILTLLAGLLHATNATGHEHAKLLVFAAIMLPGFGAALTGIRDQGQFRLHEVRSARTADRLERLRRVMATQSSLRSIQRLAAEAQSVIAGENVDWTGVLEFQDLEMIL